MLGLSSGAPSVVATGAAVEVGTGTFAALSSFDATVAMVVPGACVVLCGVGVGVRVGVGVGSGNGVGVCPLSCSHSFGAGEVLLTVDSGTVTMASATRVVVEPGDFVVGWSGAAVVTGTSIFCVVLVPAAIVVDV